MIDRIAIGGKEWVLQEYSWALHSQVKTFIYQRHNSEIVRAVGLAEESKRDEILGQYEEDIQKNPLGSLVDLFDNDELFACFSLMFEDDFSFKDYKKIGKAQGNDLKKKLIADIEKAENRNELIAPSLAVIQALRTLTKEKPEKSQ